MQRASDVGGTAHFQSDRFFLVNSQWFYATRELDNCGPFRTRELAEQDLASHLQLVASCKLESNTGAL